MGLQQNSSSTTMNQIKCTTSQSPPAPVSGLRASLSAATRPRLEILAQYAGQGVFCSVECLRVSLAQATKRIIANSIFLPG